MPSSITLTVSHLPQSTSFFLSALQPLDYMYRGRTDNTIGFGSSIDRSAPPDFWITQEVPGVPSGAAHVAFRASSHRKVESFFTAALKAGGHIYAEPAVRDGSGYYSAAVIDFDGNSIEAVFRPSYSDDKENANAKSIISRVSTTKSNNSFREHSQDRTVSGDVLDNIFAEVRSAAGLAQKAMQHVRPPPVTAKSEPLIPTRSTSSDSTAVISTLLGVAAGAAITYVLSSSSDKDDKPEASGRSSVGREKSYRGKSSSRHGDDFSETKSIARSHSSRRTSVPSIENIECRSSQSHHSRRHSTSIIPSATGCDNRSSCLSATSGDHGHFQPIRMIEPPPASSHHSASARPSNGSQISTIRPHRPAPYTGSERSGRTKSYPPSAFPGGYPTPPSSVSTARKAPLPPSRSNSSYHSSRERSSSRSRASVPPEKYPLPPSRQESFVTSIRSPSARGLGKRQSIMDEELRPEDSISQISFNGSRAGSRNGSRRRR